MDLNGQVALVTGASSGIGWATAMALAEAGAEVHAVARRADRLVDLANRTGAIVHTADLLVPAQRLRLARKVAPDILVNNAGLGAGISGLMGASADDIERTIGTNVTALLDLLRLMLPGMVERGIGHVVNLGSVAGLYPINSAVYGGSKGAVCQISRNLRIELAGTPIRVTEIQPGRVSTEFYDASVADPDTCQRLKTTGIAELQPEDIAAAVLYAVMAPAHVNVSTIELQPVEQVFGGVGFHPLDGD